MEESEIDYKTTSQNTIINSLELRKPAEPNLANKYTYYSKEIVCSVVVILVVCLENRNRSVTKYIQVPVVKKKKQQIWQPVNIKVLHHKANKQFETKIAQNYTTLAKS